MRWRSGGCALIDMMDDGIYCPASRTLKGATQRELHTGNIEERPDFSCLPHCPFVLASAELGLLSSVALSYARQTRYGMNRSRNPRGSDTWLSITWRMRQYIVLTALLEFSSRIPSFLDHISNISYGLLIRINPWLAQFPQFRWMHFKPRAFGR